MWWSGPTRPPQVNIRTPPGVLFCSSEYRYWRSSEKGEGLGWNSQGWLCQEEGPGESGRWLQLEETERRWEEPGGTGNP